MTDTHTQEATPVANPVPDGTVAAAPGPGEASAAPTNGEQKEEKPRVARPRLPKFPDEHIIHVLKPKAKTGKSGERFDQYRDGMTVKEYVDLMTADPWKRTVGQVFVDLRWDTNPHRQLIRIDPPGTVIEPPPAPAQAQPPVEPPPTQPAA